MDHHRIDADSVNALREIARAVDAVKRDRPDEEAAVVSSAPVAVLRDLRARGFVTITLGVLGKTHAAMTPAGRDFLVREDAAPAQRLPSRTLVGSQNYTLGF